MCSRVWGRCSWMCQRIAFTLSGSDLSEAVQHLARDAVVPHHRFPMAQAAQLALDHESPNPLGGFVQQNAATLVGAGSVSSSIEGAQACQRLLDLAAQGSQGLRFLLEDLVVEHVPARLSGQARSKALGWAKGHARLQQNAKTREKMT